MKPYLFFILSLLLLSGCVNQEPVSPPSDSSDAINPYAPDNQTPSQPDQDSAQGQSKSSGSKYMVNANILQYYQQIRYQDRSMYIANKRQPVVNYDNITKSYGVVVDIFDLSYGSSAPLKEPNKAVVKLIGPGNKEIKLTYNSISSDEYDKMPNIFKWSFPVQDGYNSAFAISSSYTYLSLDTSEKLKGVYNLVIDVEGDGEIDAEKEILVPGAEITSPFFGSSQSANGFNIEWTQAGTPQDFHFKADLGWDIIVDEDETLTTTSVYVSPEVIDEPSTKLLNFQIKSRFSDEDTQDYMAGSSSNKKVTFQLVGASEYFFLHFNVGEFCHCDDFFEHKGSCSVDEIDNDPLC